MNEAQRLITFIGDLLPLKSYNRIIEANVLRIDWGKVVITGELNFYYGQPALCRAVCEDKRTVRGYGVYLVQGRNRDETRLRNMLVQEGDGLHQGHSSKSSVCINKFNMSRKIRADILEEDDKNGAVINFAYKPFVWSSEAVEEAAVHCAIVGCTSFDSGEAKFIYDQNGRNEATHINPYLYDALDIWITNRMNKPRTGISKITAGSPPTDDGGLLMTADEKLYLKSKYSVLTRYIRPSIGAREFLHDKVGEYSRYCLWFKGGNPSNYDNIPEIKARFEKVKAIRERSNVDRIRKMADYSYLFCQTRQPSYTYMVIPLVSSETRKYIPIGFMSPEVIASDACIIISDVSTYEFSVLSSRLHVIWVHILAGRLEMRIRYSPAVYNNFEWPSPSEKQKARI